MRNILINIIQQNHLSSYKEYTFKNINKRLITKTLIENAS